MKTKLYLSVLSLALSVAGLAACDKASPVAPAGTVLSVTANPTQIAANGVSQIRVVALRANGTPVNPGTQIRLSTNLGTVDPLVEVGEGGIAVGTLQGDGRIGTATVTAAVGAETTSTVEVAVGRAAANISLQASPPQVSREEGGVVQLIAVVRDDTGEPLADAAVNFQTEVGVLASRGAIRRTDSNGQVTDSLRVDAAELTSSLTQFTVTAVVGAGNTTQTDTSVIRVVSECFPSVSFTAVPSGSLRAQVTTTTVTGEEPITLTWDKEQDGIIDTEFTNDQNPTFVYGSGGPKTIVARVENDCGSAVATQTVDVPP